jgi:hypothetical protein
VRELDDACDLHEGSELLVRISDDDVHQWRVQRGGLLHEYLHPRPNFMRRNRARDVHPRSQRLLGLCGHGLPDRGELLDRDGEGRV